MKLSPLLMIFLTILIDMVGFGIVIPILPLYAEQMPASPVELGLLMASYSMMQLIFTPLLGKWSDQVGRRPVLIVSLFGTALSFLMMGLAQTLLLLFIGRIIDGITGGNISTAQAYIADITPLEQRSKAMGIIGAAFGLGFMLGPAIGGLMSEISLEAPFYFAAGLAFLNALLLGFFLPESLSPEKRVHRTSQARWLEVFKRVQGTPILPVLLCMFTTSIGFAGVTALFTLVTAHRLGWTAQDNGWLFAYIGLMGVLVQGVLIGRLIPIFGEKKLVITGMALLMLGMFLLTGLPSESEGWIWLACTGIASGNGLTTPLLSGWASRLSDSRSQGVVLGLGQSMSSLGRLTGPFVGGVLLQFEPSLAPMPYGASIFLFGGLVMAATLFLAVSLRQHAEPVSLLEAA